MWKSQHPLTLPLKLNCESEDSSLEYMKMLNYLLKSGKNPTSCQSE